MTEGRLSPSQRIARMAAVRALALWYAVSIALAFAIPDGLPQIAVGVLMLLLLGAYCSVRPRHGDLIGWIAIAPILAAFVASDLVGLPAWTVAYPGALIALAAIARIERGAAGVKPADTDRAAAR